MLAALQAVPDAELPQCDDKRPERIPCTEPLPVVIPPAKVLRLPDLAELGGESLRVTTMPSLGGVSELYQVTLDPQGRTTLLAVWTYGHPYSGWREIGREEVDLTGREYRRLAAQVDAALARPDPPFDGTICLDGTGMRTERHRNGHTEPYEAWGCGGERSNLAFDLVAAFACRQIGREAPLAMVRSSCSSRLRRAREDD